MPVSFCMGIFISENKVMGYDIGLKEDIKVLIIYRRDKYLLS